MSLIDNAANADPRFYGGHIYVRPPRPIEFPAFESPEEEVAETKRHLENRTALYLVLKDAFAATSSVGSDQFMYWDPKDPRRNLSPDILVKLGAPDRPFRVWKTWERSAPDLGVEIISDSDRRRLKAEIWGRIEAERVPDAFVHQSAQPVCRRPPGDPGEELLPGPPTWCDHVASTTLTVVGRPPVIESRA